MASNGKRTPRAAASEARKKECPEGTRLAILEAAERLLARDGPEGLSITQVAQLAGINRSTAHQHFRTRESLVQAVTSWVSERLRRAVFGQELATEDAGEVQPHRVAERMATFAIENPQLVRIWLFEVLSSGQPRRDPFWKQYFQQFEKFANSDKAQPGIDTDVHCMLVLMSTFMWPTFMRAQQRTGRERDQIALRYSMELMRLSMYGTLRREKFTELDARTRKNTPMAPALAQTSPSFLHRSIHEV